MYSRRFSWFHGSNLAPFRHVQVVPAMSWSPIGSTDSIGAGCCYRMATVGGNRAGSNPTQRGQRQSIHGSTWPTSGCYRSPWLALALPRYSATLVWRQPLMTQPTALWYFIATG